jgi:zeaxanthin glucosyltransferase
MYLFLGLVPMSLGMPYAHVWSFLPVDASGTTPPCFFSWPHETAPEVLTRNVEGVIASGEIFAPVAQVAMAYAEKIGLQIDWNDPAATTSKLVVITQIPKEFDFPGTPWPAQFHYAGPFHHSERREPIPFLGRN